MSIRSELEAVQALKASFESLSQNDPELLADTIEGETSLFEIFDKMIWANGHDTAYIKACELAIQDMQDRKDRFAKRIESRRSLIEQAMMICELPKVERPLATLSMQNRAAQVLIVDESEVPSRFWKAADPKLDKKAIGDALKLGDDVPGACLSNKAPSLTIRTK
jgi:hypothetical protein